MYGSLLILIAISMQALSNGLLSDNLSGSESLLLSFTAFSAATVVFGVVARVRRAREGEAGRENGLFHGERLRLLVQLNVATAVTFLGFYWSLSLVPAPLASAVETGIGPLAMACYGLRSRTPGHRLPQLTVGALTLAFALAVAGRVVSAGRIASVPTFTAGLAVAAVAGTSAAGIAALSHRLGRLKVSPVQVTAHRFHLTYLLALAALLLGSDQAPQLSGSRIAFIVLVALGGATVPLFVLQIGMQRTPPMTVTLLASAVPGLTYLMATSLGSQAFDPLTFALINGSFVVAFLGPKLIEHSGNRAANSLPRVGRSRREPQTSSFT